MAYVDLIREIHTATERDYLSRVTSHDKAVSSEVAKRFGSDYFDGERRYGYGGYRYDGRWKRFAAAIAAHYELQAGARVLDVGCAKGFLVHDLRTVAGSNATGVDVSRYAIEHAFPEAREHVSVADAVELPFEDSSFDLVVSINTLHNLRLPDLERALQEIERVGTGHSYIVVDGYRTGREKMNLMYWQLTCECFFSPEEWDWLFAQVGYTGDYACVFFE
ncbi:MAG TPA: class I SAM-dependent methyltransferase [Plantibacter sp.]|uniref:class I SAM-dependent methyltransferase n=1 Tax=Plantibacter sp. TaxID=1871045 RepID=UPI002B54BE42|nr:class I SAM-dependent methyltransferase [Plantibacter sp.]